MQDETKNPADTTKNTLEQGGIVGAPGNPQQDSAQGALGSIGAVIGKLPEPSAPETEPMKNDIEKILKEIKLPERRTSGASDIHPRQIEVKNFDTVLGAETKADIQEQKVAAAQQPTNPVPKSEEDTSVVAMHTLKQDLKSVVHDKNISVVRAASLEQSRARPEPIDTLEPPRKSVTTSVVIASLSLLLLGGAALLGVYYIGIQKTTPSAKPQTDSLVFAEQSVPFPLSGKTSSVVKSQLAQLKNTSNASLGSITRIIPTFSVASESGATTERVATFSEVLTSFGGRVPDSLVRALSDTFFFGIHAVDENAPIIVVPVTSYDRAFAGMLEWEKNINMDLSPIFPAIPNLMVDANGLPALRIFTDTVMRNYDVRALKDDSGAIQLYYSFPTRDILIIGESPYTFDEILSRLQAGRRL